MKNLPPFLETVSLQKVNHEFMGKRAFSQTNFHSKKENKNQMMNIEDYFKKLENKYQNGVNNWDGNVKNIQQNNQRHKQISSCH